MDTGEPVCSAAGQLNIHQQQATTDGHAGAVNAQHLSIASTKLYRMWIGELASLPLSSPLLSPSFPFLPFFPFFLSLSLFLPLKVRLLNSS